MPPRQDRPCGWPSQRQRGLLSAHTGAWHRKYVEYGVRGGLRSVQAVRHTEILSQSAHRSVRCAHSTSCFLTLPDLTQCQIENCHARVNLLWRWFPNMVTGALVLSTPILPWRPLLRRRHNHQFTPCLYRHRRIRPCGFFEKKGCLVVDDFQVRVSAHATR